MALWENPPHAVSSYTSDVSRDGGGGTQLVFTLAQSAIPCSINTASASTISLYAQSAIRVTHTVAFLASAVTTALTPGMKLVADDTSDSYHIGGIRKGRAYGSIPAFVYADCDQIL